MGGLDQGAGLAPATVWSSAATYGLGALVVGSDSNLYASLVAGNTNHDPVGDEGVHWTNTPQSLDDVVAVANGGTGATSIAEFRTEFGSSAWTLLTLGTNIQALGGAPAPAYLIDAAGILHLRGALTGTSGHNIAAGATVASLPNGIAPSANSFVPCGVSLTGASNATGIAFIQTNGAILWDVNSAITALTGYLALDGISVPVYV